MCLGIQESSRNNRGVFESSRVDGLQMLPFFGATIADLKQNSQLTLLLLLELLSVDAWWGNHAIQLPFWCTGCQAILLLQASSKTMTELGLE